MYLAETPEQQALRKELREYFAALLTPEVRESVREKSSLELARERAKQIMGEIEGNFEGWKDEFLTPTPPEGWSYEWKAIKILNKVDETKLSEVRRTGWTEVPRVASHEHADGDQVARFFSRLLRCLDQVGGPLRAGGDARVAPERQGGGPPRPVAASDEP